MSISSSVSRVGIEKEIKEAHDGDIMRLLFVSSWEVLRVLKMKINLFLLANYVLWKQAICQTLKQAFSLEMHGKLFVACTHFGAGSIAHLLPQRTCLKMMGALLSVSGMSYFLPLPQCMICAMCTSWTGGLTYIIWSVYNLDLADKLTPLVTTAVGSLALQLQIAKKQAWKVGKPVAYRELLEVTNASIMQSASHFIPLLFLACV